MAPDPVSLVSVLVGASPLLLLATPFAIRYELVRRGQLAVVAMGFLIGAALPAYALGTIDGDGLRVVRQTLWSSLHIKALAVSGLFLLVATVVVTAAANRHRDDAASRVGRLLTGAVCVALTAALACGILGVGLYVTENLELVAALYGRERPRAGAALLFAWSLLTGAGVAVITERIDSGTRATDPTAGTVIGLLVALLGWLVGVLFALPVWMEYAFDYRLPIPYLHWQSLIGLVLFALVFGTCYPLLRRFVGAPSVGEAGT